MRGPSHKDGPRGLARNCPVRRRDGRLGAQGARPMDRRRLSFLTGGWLVWPALSLDSSPSTLSVRPPPPHVPPARRLRQLGHGSSFQARAHLPASCPPQRALCLLPRPQDPIEMVSVSSVYAHVTRLPTSRSLSDAFLLFLSCPYSAQMDDLARGRARRRGQGRGCRREVHQMWRPSLASAWTSASVRRREFLLSSLFFWRALSPRLFASVSLTRPC